MREPRTKSAWRRRFALRLLLAFGACCLTSPFGWVQAPVIVHRARVNLGPPQEVDPSQPIDVDFKPMKPPVTKVLEFAPIKPSAPTVLEIAPIKPPVTTVFEPAPIKSPTRTVLEFAPIKRPAMTVYEFAPIKLPAMMVLEFEPSKPSPMTVLEFAPSKPPAKSVLEFEAVKPPAKTAREPELVKPPVKTVLEFAPMGPPAMTVLEFAPITPAPSVLKFDPKPSAPVELPPLPSLPERKKELPRPVFPDDPNGVIPGVSKPNRPGEASVRQAIDAPMTKPLLLPPALAEFAVCPTPLFGATFEATRPVRFDRPVVVQDPRPVFGGVIGLEAGAFPPSSANPVGLAPARTPPPVEPSHQ